MNLLGTQYTLKNKAYEIYLAGCGRPSHCEGCHNPESWDFNAGIKITNNTIENISAEINNHADLVENIWILGGEPLDQPLDSFLYFMVNLLTDTNCKIWLFTGYDLDTAVSKLLERNSIGMCRLLCVDYLKYGEYKPELTVDNHIEHGIQLASSNQHIMTLMEIEEYIENKLNPHTQIKLNSNKELVSQIQKKLKQNGGYCPCVPKYLWNADTKCPCKEFREMEQGECNCGLYIKTPKG